MKRPIDTFYYIDYFCIRNEFWMFNFWFLMFEAEPRQRLIHGLQSRFSPLLARAIFHHERSEFFTTATPFFTVRRQPNLSSEICPCGQVKLLARRAVKLSLSGLVKLSATRDSWRRDCGCSPQRDCAWAAQRDSRLRVNEIAQLVLGSERRKAPAGAGGYIEPLAQLYCACGTVISAPDGAGYIVRCADSRKHGGRMPGDSSLIAHQAATAWCGSCLKYIKVVRRRLRSSGQSAGLWQQRNFCRGRRHR